MEHVQESRIKVLVADDDPVQRRMLKLLLERWGYAVETADNGQAALQVMESSSRTIQLVIADWMMPGMDGLTLCRRIRTRFNDPYVYLVLLTSRDKMDDVVTGLDAGADDYLTKPIHHSELSARVRAARRILDLQQKLLFTQEQLREQAMRDALTGLLNRRAIFEVLQKEMERADRQNSSMAVIMTDLDHFKRINDTHGHLIGDEVLQAAARKISGAVRSYDSVGRYGGEEFLIIAPEFDSPGARSLAERIRQGFASAPIETSGPAIDLTMSLGVVALTGAALTGASRIAINQVISAADEALYRAKKTGRNATEVGTL